MAMNGNFLMYKQDLKRSNEKERYLQYTNERELY
jgi:hypothetical protein